MTKTKLTKDEAYALGARLGAERVTEAVSNGAESAEEIAAYLVKHPPAGYMVHHNRIPPPDDVTTEWGPREWAEFEAEGWEVTEYTHEPRYVVEHPDADGKTRMTLPVTGHAHQPTDGWAAAYGDPANALRHRDHLSKHHPPKKGKVKVRHREKGHEIEWSDDA